MLAASRTFFRPTFFFFGFLLNKIMNVGFFSRSGCGFHGRVFVPGASRYRESLRTVQSRWDCPCAGPNLCCVHGMYPQRTHLSSRSGPNKCRLLLLALASLDWVEADWVEAVDRRRASEAVLSGFYHLVFSRFKMKTELLHDLYLEQLKDLYDAENQLIKALPRMA